MSVPCCGSDRKTALLISVSALLVIAVIGWVREANKPPQIVEQPVEVEVVGVLVAAKDLTTGTAFTKANVDELTRFAHVPKSTVTTEAKLIKTKDELIGKRLSCKTHTGESFNVADINSKTILLYEPVKDILPIRVPESPTAFLDAGSRVDVLAVRFNGTQREAFTLLPDMIVLVSNREPYYVGKPAGPEMTIVALSVYEEQAQLLVVANELNYNFEVAPLPADSPKKSYDPEKTLALLQSLKKQQDSRMPVAPAPRAVGGS